MSMNISNGRPKLAKVERFSPIITMLVFLVPLLCAGAIGYYIGPAWGIALLVVILWSDFILRSASVNFRGKRKKDKVMAPLVQKSFSCHTPDDTLGWKLTPSNSATNSFAIPRKGLRLDYTVTTDAEGRRHTGQDEAKDKPAISFYGCSNTFGWGLDDESTYPWLIQQDRPDYTINNYGVSGYSLYQMLLTMEQTIAKDTPEVVVLGFSPGLEARSVSDHHYLRILSEQGGTPPSCISMEKGDGKRSLKRFGLEGYKHLPLSDKSPLMKLIERRLNKLKFGSRLKDDAHRKTTEHLLLSMENLCKKHNAVFHVQYLVANTGYREFLHKTGVNWAPGPVDLDQCDDKGAYRYRLYPFDGHPNSLANEEYAKVLQTILSELLESGTYTPDPGALGTTKRDEATESAIYPIF